jgi:hypothetical protein
MLCCSANLRSWVFSANLAVAATQVRHIHTPASPSFCKRLLQHTSGISCQPASHFTRAGRLTAGLLLLLLVLLVWT